MNNKDFRAQMMINELETMILNEDFLPEWDNHRKEIRDTGFKNPLLKRRYEMIKAYIKLALTTYNESNKYKDFSILVEQRKKALKYKNWEAFFKKIEGRCDAGSKVEIQWVDRTLSDYGYIFTLPNMDLDENDFFINIPNPDNSDGIGAAPEVHIHSYELASLDRVKKIICSLK